MAYTKKQIVYKILIFAIVALFPLGHLISIRTQIMGSRIVIVPIDVLAGGVLLTLIFSNFKYFAKKFTNPHPLLFAAFFSAFYTLTIFSLKEVLVGSLYLVRVASYWGLYKVLTVYLERKDKRMLMELLAIAVFVAAIIGLLQYFLLPDLRDSVSFGWDAHWFRLVGSFIDPGFTGIILVLGFLVSINLYGLSKQKRFLLFCTLFVTALLLTYSRASYLAFFVGCFVTATFLSAVRRITILALLIFFIAIPLLPRPAGVGVKLERVHSVYTRIENYNETYDLWKTSPLFGFGFNNICKAKQNMNKPAQIGLNSCSGADSSLFLILDTVGIVGLLILIKEAFISLKKVKLNPTGITVISCVLAVLVHSMFDNSLTYPFVLAFMSLLIPTI